MPRGEHRRAAFAVAIAVFAIAVVECVALYKAHTWIYRDVRFYINTNVTLVEDLSLEQSRFASSWYNGRLGWNYELPASFSNIALGRNGEHWPMHPFVMPLLSTPLFWAFDLHGTLLFSLLCAAVIAGSGYRFARAYVGPGPAAVATLAFLYATGQRDYFYYYSIDSLLCATFSVVLYGIVTGRAWLAGLALGLSVVIKPTTMMHGPALLLLFLEHRRALGFAGRGALAASAVVGAWGAGNTYLFGAPWHAAYTRVLVVHGGVPQMESDLEAFDTPFRQGLSRVWSGEFGLRQHFTIFALAAPGMAALFFRRPLYALGATISAAASLYVFSRFEYEGFRFHFPTFALLLPALGASAQVVHELADLALRRLRAWVKLEAGVAAMVLAVAAGTCAIGFGGPIERQLGDAPWVQGAMALGRSATIDLRADRAVSAPPEAQSSPYARGRFGHWLARSSPAVVLAAAPFAAVGGKTGLAVLVVVAAGLAAFGGARLASRASGEGVAAACAFAAVVLPRDGLLPSGPAWMALACALWALDLALESRWLLAGFLSVMSAWMADAPWLIAPAVGLLALLSGKRALLRACLGAAVPLVLWGVGHLVLIGRPFASPDDFVLVQGLGGAETTVPLAHRTLAKAWWARTSEPGMFRGLVVLAPLAVGGLLVALRRAPRAAIALLALLATPLVAATGPVRGQELTVLPPLLVAALLLGAAPFFGAAGSWAARLAERLRGWRGVAAALAVLVALGAFGAVRRSRAASRPWRIESVRSLREAAVHLGSTPCDFLTWEHMTWECSHHDSGEMGMTGLASQDGVRVGGHEVAVFVVPTGARGMVRRVVWEHVAGGRELLLSWAVPDGHRGGAAVEVRVDDREVARFETPSEPTGRLRSLRVATPRAVGREVRLEISARGIGPAHQAITVFAGGFRP